MRILLAFLSVFVGFLTLASAALAADQPTYGPVPAWVKSAPIPERPAAKSGAYQLLVDDVQVRFNGDEEHQFRDTVYKVLNRQGLEDLGTLTAGWDPAIHTLVIHRAEIIRGSQVIDLLAGDERFTVLRREERLEEALLDGALTAIKEVKGLRVGDMVRLSTSVVQHEHIPGARPEAWTTLSHPGEAAYVRYRALWPKSLNVQVKTTEGYGPAKRTEIGDDVEVVSEMFDVKTPEAPEGAPQRFNTLAELELSGFSGWREVSRMMAPLYQKAATLKPDSPLKEEAAKIKAAHATPEARALAALQLVQTEVRYLALVMGQGGLDPAPADETWTARFGDCKGKTALLLALLAELGIKAEPALVDTESGDALALRLPRVGAFDHVIVRAEIGGKIYWMDGTQPNDRNLAELAQGYFGYALPVQVAGSDLEKMELRPAESPLIELDIDVDARNGLNEDASVKLTVLLRGIYGQATEEMIADSGIEAAKEELRRSYAEDVGGDMELEDMQMGYDESVGAYRATLTLRGKVEWETAQGVRFFALLPGYEYEVAKRPAGQDGAAPYLLDYPGYSVVRTRMRFREEDGRALQVFGGQNLNVTAGNIAVRRTISKTATEAVAELSTRTMAPEVDGRAIDQAVRAFNQSNAQMATALVWSGPTRVNARQDQLRGHLERAQARFEARDYAGTLEATEQVLKMDSRNGRAMLLRSWALLEQGQYAQALREGRRAASVTGEPLYASTPRYQALLSLKNYRELLSETDKSLRISPKDASSLRMRAVALAGLERPADMLATYEALYEAMGPAKVDFGVADLRAVLAAKTPEQLQALDQVLVSRPQSPTARVLRGWTLGLNDQRLAIPQYDQALALAPTFEFARRLRISSNVSQKSYPNALTDLDHVLEQNRSAEFLTLRGDVYARLDQADKALKDYDEAIGLDPNNPRLLNQRCWLRARMNIEPQKALADCSEAIRLLPTFSAAYDSRGLVNLRLGRNADAIADYDSALADRSSAHSLYGRSLARTALKDSAGAEADRVKAIALDAAIGGAYEGYGLRPQ